MIWVVDLGYALFGSLRYSHDIKSYPSAYSIIILYQMTWWWTLPYPVVLFCCYAAWMSR